ncbi:NapC/NirT family cytochrome c [Metallumcola ferriviriculae]|uniref:NapC/NirT family cytochrome c n=1 Tax=Metallumcola ferriviriculae TaxID=3039180 RepID=A0AAU0UM37_9FIRM|nr:NapC/NirT family cytochrome c [Desulfitibacteraceae bacterium MK1]
MAKRNLKLIILVSGFLLIAVTILGVEFSSQPRFCYNCHEMGMVYEAWQTGFHQDISCLKCHAEPGIDGLIRTKAKGLREVYVHFTNPQIEPKAEADTWEFSQRCLACHDIKGKGGPHNEKHFAMEFTCVSCHKGIGHDPDKNDKLPSRDICQKCHG